MFKPMMQARAMQNGDAKAVGNGLSAGNFGPKYEQHVTEMQRQLDEANKKYASLARVSGYCLLFIARCLLSPAGTAGARCLVKSWQ